MTYVTVVRGNIDKNDKHGLPLPTVRVEHSGKGETLYHEVIIHGPSKVGPIPGGRIAVQTESTVEGLTWLVKPEA